MDIRDIVGSGVHTAPSTLNASQHCSALQILHSKGFLSYDISYDPSVTTSHKKLYTDLSKCLYIIIKRLIAFDFKHICFGFLF